MKFSRKYTLKEIAKIIGSSFVGADDFPVLGMNEIHVVTPGDIVFVDHPKYYDKALESAATIVLINKEVECPEGKALLISDDPFRDFNKLTQYFKPFIAATSTVSETAKIGEGTVIQPNVIIGENVVIGNNCIIHSNVVIGNDTVIGNNVVVQANTVLGGDAFYYKNRPTGFDRLLSSGRVVLEDKVEIGVGCAIDRGVTGDTLIMEDTKIDNLVQIGHDTIVGKKCLIASQVGIAGCVVIGNEVTIWGQVGIASAITIGDKAVLLAQSGISKSLDGHKSYFGYPADDIRTKYKELATLKKLPETMRALKEKGL